ncbi:MAG TPA: nucleotidyltransferase family protein [Caldimonas sp.]|nr:nucleotidyltransferase family protein [Caldimonas sp.]HEX4234750.1 nucleotidyltransferase family protein [Caldimonas sp.]
MAAQPTLVVLAAGRSSRFGAGHHKLAQPLGDSTVLAQTLASAIASHLRTVVVTTTPFVDVARSSVAARDVVVLAEVGSDGANLLGMGVSIAAGVRACPDSSGWLVLPGDMPLIQPTTLVAVARAIEHHAIAFAQHRGRRGHPVGFAAELYPELTALVGDEGARRIVARYPAFPVELDDTGILVDIDTEDDLEALRRNAAASPPGASGAAAAARR